MRDEIDILRIQFADERASHRIREAFLSSVILHLLLIILILVSPKLFPRSANVRNADLASADERKDLGFLALPKDYQKLLRKPKTPVLADKDRMHPGQSAEGRSPRSPGSLFGRQHETTGTVGSSRCSATSCPAGGSAAREPVTTAVEPATAGKQTDRQAPVAPAQLRSSTSTELAGNQRWSGGSRLFREEIH